MKKVRHSSTYDLEKIDRRDEIGRPVEFLENDAFHPKEFVGGTRRIAIDGELGSDRDLLVFFFILRGYVQTTHG